MKLIIRIDDVGYTNTCNIGAFQTIEQGIATAADVMLDTPGTEDALLRLRDFPWISVGWHTHFWGSPVSPAEQVSTLVMNDQGRLRFRKDLHESTEVNFDEAMLECRAQLNRCIRILGRAPDTGMFFGASPMDRAIRQACDEYGIVYNFTYIQSGFPGMGEPPTVDPRWAGRRIRSVDSMSLVSHLLADSVDEWEKYDPVTYFIQDQAHLLDFTADDVIVQAWHPGSLDYFVYRQGDYGRFARNFLLARLVDAEALCSPAVKQWICDNRVELVNFRDALYGTQEIQNHLRAIGSDLFVR